MKKKSLYLAQNMLRLYFGNHISRASAALSYFFMLSVFPLLICLYSMLGRLFPSGEDMKRLLADILPGGAVNILMEYLGYVRDNSNAKMLVAAFAAMASSSAAGFRIIDKVMHELRGIKRGERQFAFLLSFVYSLMFLFALYVAAVLISCGGWFLRLLDNNSGVLDISHNWEWFRFVLLFFVLFVFILGAYRLCSPNRRNLLLVPGAFWASIALVGVSLLFSWFIEVSIKYPLLYGSLASVMIMLLWLYICGNVLFLGCILNISLEEINKRTA